MPEPTQQPSNRTDITEPLPCLHLNRSVYVEIGSGGASLVCKDCRQQLALWNGRKPIPNWVPLCLRDVGGVL